MKILLILFTLVSLSLFSQVDVITEKPAVPLKTVKKPSDFGSIESLGDVKEKARPILRRHKEIPNKLRRYSYTNENALPKKRDSVRQYGHLKSTSLTPIKSWEGIDESSQQVSPPDPTGAAGLIHYVQMVNTAMQVFDKNGNSLWGPTMLSSVFPNSTNDGDPIVLYDQFANRWFISQFQSTGNKMLIAISKTSDPLGAWFYYEYLFDDFPDYPKFSIWHDGYYMTANVGAQNAVCFERDKMLKGDMSARMVALTIPDMESNGFFSPLPAHASGDVMPTDPINFFYFQDDGWASGSDRIKIWEMNVDWDSPEDSKIELTQEINVAPFNTDFTESWQDLTQPGTSQKLDAVPGAFMYMAHYRSYKEYNSIALCHTVDVDLTSDMNSAVRWYELHEKEGVWSLEQESTYAPDNENRWMGSIALDRQGNIGLAYSVTSSTTYPSIRFTGRKKGDDLGKMTVSESNAFNGSGVQDGNQRYGDYAHMTIDPVDGLTFWHTGEFMGESGWETGIFSFKIGDEYDDDISLIKVESPKEGVYSNSETVTVLIKNVGKNTVSNFPLSFSLDGIKRNDLFSGSIAAGDTAYFTFLSKIDLSSSGDHELVVFSELVSDGDKLNDTIFTILSSPYPYDAGITQILSPKSGVGLKNEIVTVKIKNYGTQTLNTIPLLLEVDGVEVMDTLSTPMLGGTLVEYSFKTAVDLSDIKVHELIAMTNLSNDQKESNDTAKTSVETYNCNPISDCSFTDKIVLFKFNTINNVSDCSSDGYGDFTDQSTDLKKDETYPLYIKVQEDDHQASVWIDFNDNQVFESEELLIENKEYSQEGVFNISIPSDASLGVHLLRVRTNWDAKSSDPCKPFDYGETEDYSVEIVSPDNTEEIEGLMFEVFGQYGFININLEKVYSEDLHLTIVNGVGQQMFYTKIDSGVKFDKALSVNGFAPGIYYVKVSDEKRSSVKQFVVK